jgi:ubiquinone/menaquinone biosynthesis C-methylase UbiE
MHHVLDEIHRVLKPSGRFVVAMVRRPGGSVGAAATRALVAIGISPFGEAELKEALGAAGFSNAEQHFGRRLWMVWSAMK